MSADDDVEYTLTQLPQVCVFKIPPRMSSEGYRAADWPTQPSWTGKLRIVAKGKIASIILYDEKNPSFAVCKVTDETCVEKVLDSGRYFVLKITNSQGRHAFIGIAFNERNDSFDFNVALSEFRSQLEREDMASKGLTSTIPPLQDMSLKEGEKIKIKINRSKSSGEGSVRERPVAKSSNLVGGVLLPPPKKGNLAPHKITAPIASDPSATSSDPFGDSDPFGADPFENFSSMAASSAAVNPSSVNQTAFSFAATPAPQQSTDLLDL